MTLMSSCSLFLTTTFLQTTAKHRHGAFCITFRCGEPGPGFGTSLVGREEDKKIYTLYTHCTYTYIYNNIHTSIHRYGVYIYKQWAFQANYIAYKMRLRFEFKWWVILWMGPILTWWLQGHVTLKWFDFTTIFYNDVEYMYCVYNAYY